MFSIIGDEFNKFKYSSNVINALFFLLLGVSSNFIGDTMGCQVQQLFNSSIFFKQLIVFFTIFFGIDISDGKNLKVMSKLKISAIVFILFTLLANMNIKFSIIIFSLITTLYILNTYISELKLTMKDSYEIKEKYNKMINIRKQLGILFLAVIAVGVFFYYRLKKKEFGDEFDNISFLFAQNSCKFNEKLDLDIDFLTGDNFFSKLLNI